MEVLETGRMPDNGRMFIEHVPREQPLCQGLVKVIATQVRVSVGVQHLKSALKAVQQADIQCSTSEVKDQHILIPRRRARAIRKCSCNRLCTVGHKRFVKAPVGLLDACSRIAMHISCGYDQAQAERPI